MKPFASGEPDPIPDAHGPTSCLALCKMHMSPPRPVRLVSSHIEGLKHKYVSWVTVVSHRMVGSA